MTDPERQAATAIRITRRFAAPAQAVFEAWTSAELLLRWYPPGADWDTPVAEVDLRVGGRLRLVMRSPDGEEFGGGGEYREITPPTRLVFTWAWDRLDVAEGVQLVEVDFTEHPDGTTTVVMTNHGLVAPRGLGGFLRQPRPLGRPMRGGGRGWRRTLCWAVRSREERPAERYVAK